MRSFKRRPVSLHACKCRCMNDAASELQGIRGGVPQHAEPVARELAALVATIACKATSHAARASSTGAWDDCIEAVCSQGAVP